MLYARIYQINPERDDNHLLGLNSMSISRKFGSFIVLSAYYDLVYDDPIPDAESIRDIIKFFDHNVPNGYKGRNIISSDVIEIIQVDYPTIEGFYFIDGLEIRVLESFNVNATRNAITSRNANMLDPCKYHPGNMEE